MNDELNDLQKEIDMAFKLISSIPVKEDSVELMAAAKSHLRKAYKMAGEPPQDTE